MMNYLEKLKKVLSEDRRKLVQSIEQARFTRDNSPSAMESHSDTTKSQYEKLVYALEQKLKELDRMISHIPDKILTKSDVSLWQVVEFDLGENKLTVMLVPEGFGGKKFDTVTTLAINTPLGSAIENKTIGKEFLFGDKKGKIIKILA